MTAPPLPASPCLRVRLNYLFTDAFEAGSRFYLSYSGAAPTAGNCATLASDIAAAWNSHLASLISADVELAEVDVLDIATDSGLSGQWTGADPGTIAGNLLTQNVAQNIEFNIARRYRGGKPRMYLPSPSNAELTDTSHWSSAHVTALNTGIAAFMSEIEALSIGAIGTLAHVNLSYYSGFTNVTNSSGRTRAAPKYRTTALVDTVSGYSAKATVGSQRRRRTSTTY
jgi:hypothetical protein